MMRFVIALFVAALLGGCVVVPDYGYYGGPRYGHRHHHGGHHYRGDGPGWRQHDYR